MSRKVLHKTSYVTAFSRAFDVFLEIRECVQMQVDVLLFPSEFNEHRHTCPCCVNKLSEEKADFLMLFCIDGNESLKPAPTYTRQVLNASGARS